MPIIYGGMAVVRLGLGFNFSQSIRLCTGTQQLYDSWVTHTDTTWDTNSKYLHRYTSGVTERRNLFWWGSRKLQVKKYGWH